jgi:nucleoside-diphosphate-sugar epimerase
MNTIAIAGASGYIGQSLVAELIRMDDVRIKILTREKQRNPLAGLIPAIDVVTGDLREPESLGRFVEEGCVVINLAYLWDAGEQANLEIVRNLHDVCRAANVRRLIHCSTADVTGRTNTNPIVENTDCQPVTEYAATKLGVEKALLERPRESFDTVILRPTAVFGPGSKNLKKLADDLTSGNRLKNYLRSCLFGHRRMNLVNIDNVVASLIFLSNYPQNIDKEIFIVSDDDAHLNNFADVERFLMREFSIRDYPLPRIPVPSSLLSFLLARLDRNNVNPLCTYDSAKLQSCGFKKPTAFEPGLAEYAAWYRSSKLNLQ